MSRKVQPTYTPEEVKAAFKVFETSNSGLPPGHVKVCVAAIACGKEVFATNDSLKYQ